MQRKMKQIHSLDLLVLEINPMAIRENAKG